MATDNLLENFYKALAEGLPDMVWGFDQNYTLIVANAAFLDMRRGLYKQRLKLGDSLFTQVPEEVVNRWKPLYDRGLRGERIIMDDTRLIEGRLVNVRLSLNPVYDKDGNVCGCMGITFDVTDAMQAEANLSMNQEKFNKILALNKAQLQPKLSRFFALAAQLNQKNTYSIDDQNAMIFMINEELGFISQKLNELEQLLETE